MAEFRIVADSYLGYEVQIRRWWHYPFWVAFGINTFSTIEKAEAFARKHAFVKYLGRL